MSFPCQKLVNGSSSPLKYNSNSTTAYKTLHDLTFVSLDLLLTLFPLFLCSSHAILLTAPKTLKVCYCLRGTFSSICLEYASIMNYSSWIILFTSAGRHSLSITYYSHYSPHIPNPQSLSPCPTYFTSQHPLISELYDVSHLLSVSPL